MLRAWLSTVRSDSTSARDSSQLGTARCGQPGSRPPPRHCRPVRALRINLGKEVQVVGCWDQRAALPVQCLIDLGDTVTHPGVVHAKITSRPVVPGGIDYGVLAVGKGHGPGERVGKQVTLDCQVAAILNKKPPQVRRGHDEDSLPLVADRAVDLPRAVRTGVDPLVREHLDGAVGRQLSGLHPGRQRRRPGNVAEQVGRNHRPAAIGVADEQRDHSFSSPFAYPCRPACRSTYARDKPRARACASHHN